MRKRRRGTEAKEDKEGECEEEQGQVRKNMNKDIRTGAKEEKQGEGKRNWDTEGKNKTKNWRRGTVATEEVKRNRRRKNKEME